MVRDGDDRIWLRANFAGVNDSGDALTWAYGTQWLSRGETYQWNQCRRPTKEELES